MVNSEKVRNKIREIQKAADKLQKYREIPEDQFLQNYLCLYSSAATGVAKADISRTSVSIGDIKFAFANAAQLR